MRMLYAALMQFVHATSFVKVLEPVTSCVRTVRTFASVSVVPEAFCAALSVEVTQSVFVVVLFTKIYLLVRK